MAKQPKQLSLFSNIQMYNLSIDKTLTVKRLGRQGILYEYELPYGANPMKYYEEAANVKSIKKSTKYKNGKRPGQYQPIGDKRYFTYYQLNKMKNTADWDNYLIDLIRRRDAIMLKKLHDAIIRGVFDGLQ